MQEDMDSDDDVSWSSASEHLKDIGHSSGQSRWLLTSINKANSHLVVAESTSASLYSHLLGVLISIL